MFIISICVIMREQRENRIPAKVKKYPLSEYDKYIKRGVRACKRVLRVSPRLRET